MALETKPAVLPGTPTRALSGDQVPASVPVVSVQEPGEPSADSLGQEGDWYAILIWLTCAVLVAILIAFDLLVGLLRR
jgi:hypothetical protein